MDKATWDDLISMLKRAPGVDEVAPNGQDVVLAFGSFVTDSGAELNAEIEVVSMGHVDEVKSLFSKMSRLPGIGATE